MFWSSPELLYGLPRITGTSTFLYSTKPCGWVTPFNIRWSIPTSYERTEPPYRTTLLHHPHSFSTHQTDPSLHSRPWELLFIVPLEHRVTKNYLHSLTNPLLLHYLGPTQRRLPDELCGGGENNIHR